MIAAGRHSLLRLFLYACPFVVFGIGISFGNVAGGTKLLSMIGVLRSYAPANSLVTKCVSEMAVP